MRCAGRGATFAGVNNLAYSQSGQELTEAFEDSGGPALESYWDSTGKCWTIGYGHTGPEVVQGLVWTAAQCVDALLSDIAWAVKIVNRFVVPTLQQHQFDALVDFVFNDGAGNFEGSTLLRDVNASNMVSADLQFSEWVHSGGKVLSGLVRRRAAEAALFNSAT